jgi:UDP-2-acetamido-3-amino-2,3-dideoxy-glucuronate N-acetyltransferase
MISATAIVRSKIPDDAKVWAMSTIHEDVVFGPGVSIGELTYIGKGAVIGPHTRIGTQCHIADHTQIGARCFIAPMTITCNDRHPRANNPDYKREDVVIEDDVNIGVNVTILPGVRLGRGCTVGAGSVVTKDVPPYETWIGNPAHRLRDQR